MIPKLPHSPCRRSDDYRVGLLGSLTQSVPLRLRGHARCGLSHPPDQGPGSFASKQYRQASGSGGPGRPGEGGKPGVWQDSEQTLKPQMPPVGRKAQRIKPGRSRSNRESRAGSNLGHEISRLPLLENLQPAIPVTGTFTIEIGRKPPLYTRVESIPRVMAQQHPYSCFENAPALLPIACKAASTQRVCRSTQGMQDSAISASCTSSNDCDQ